MKITVDFDTVTKVLTATMDGVSIPDFYRAEFFSYDNNDDGMLGCAMIEATKFDEVEKTSVQTKVYASPNPNMVTDTNQSITRLAKAFRFNTK